MPTCKTCSVTIVKLFPPENAPLSKEWKVNTILPRFRNDIFSNCWICSKFSEWLKVEDPELFKSWQKKELPVTYALTSFSHLKRLQGPLIVMLLLDITAQGL